jgi:hypothetical protein
MRSSSDLRLESRVQTRSGYASVFYVVSPPSNAEVKEWVELYLHSPNTPLWRRAQLKVQDNLNFTFTMYKYGPCRSQ